MPVDALRNNVSRGSKRLRRVTLTASFLAVILLVCAIVTWRIREKHQPAKYVPGEVSKDITDTSADRGAEKPVSAPVAIRMAVSPRSVDQLLNPG